MSGILEEIVARLDRIEKALAVKTTVSVASNGAADEDQEQEEPRRKRGRPPRSGDSPAKEEYTPEQIKIKLKSVLEKKGRSTAMSILEEFDAEKIGEVDKDQYVAFIKACDKALATDDADDLDLD